MPNFLKNLKSPAGEEETNHKLTAKEILSIFGLFAIWRLALQLIAWLGLNRIILSADVVVERWFPWTKEPSWIGDFKGPLWAKIWARWDSGWYLSIVNRGYFWDGPGAQSNVAFFPLFPTLIKYLGDLFNSQYILIGIIISNLALLGACFYLYKLAKLDTKSSTALRSVFYSLIFPTALFLASMYTESLFILCAVAAFWHARKNQWTYAGLWGFLAALTRSLGIFLVLALLLEYLEQRKFNFKKIGWNILNLAFIPAGLGIYMYYLYKRFGNPWLFIQTQGAWGRETGFSLINSVKILGSYIHDLVLGGEENIAYYIVNSTDLFFFLGFLALTIFVFLKLRKSYALFMLCGLIIPFLTGTLTSMPRYVLILFPAFILLSIWSKNRIVNYALATAFSMLLALNIIMFVNSYWVG